MSVQSVIFLHSDTPDLSTREYINQVRQVAVVTNTDITTDLDNSDADFSKIVPITGTTLIMDSDFNISNEGIQVNFTGRVAVSFNLHIWSSDARSATQASIRLNNSPVGPIASTGYIRQTNGHEQSSLHVNDYILDVSNGDVIKLGTRRQPGSNVAPVTRMMEVGTSNLMLRRVG